MQLFVNLCMIKSNLFSSLQDYFKRVVQRDMRSISCVVETCGLSLVCFSFILILKMLFVLFLCPSDSSIFLFPSGSSSFDFSTESILTLLCVHGVGSPWAVLSETSAGRGWLSSVCCCTRASRCRRIQALL